MNLGLIEYLEGKNFDVEEIVALQKNNYNRKTTDEEIIKKMDAIYKVFGYADLPQLLINKLIINNMGLLDKPDHEILNIAYTWMLTGLLSDAATRKKGLIYNFYLRTYLRNQYLNSGINYNKSPISYNALVMGDDAFSSDYRGDLYKNIEIRPNFESLAKLYFRDEDFEKNKEKLEYHVSVSALGWYFKCLKKEKEKNNYGRTI